MSSSILLFFRLLRQTLLPPWPTGPWNAKRLSLLAVLVPVFLMFQLVHWVGFLLDVVFFPGYRKIEIRDPLFIVGLPRSGTTFLHRVFARDTDRFTTTRLWELLFAPSITEKKVLGVFGALNRAVGHPMARLGRWGERKGLAWLDVIHEVSLDDPEEDYFLLLPVFACFLLVVPFPYHDAVWALARFDELPESQRKRVMSFYRGAVQRHLYVAGPDKQLLSKNPSFTPFLQSLGEEFTDARFICCVREPTEVVPSLLSSIRTGASLFGYDPAEPRIRDRFVDMLSFFARHALATLDPMPERTRAFVTLREMKADVEGLVLNTYERFGWDPDAGFRMRLSEDASQGKTYKSRHSYTLEQFGLEPEAIHRRFSGLNQRFGFGPGTNSAGIGTAEGP
jgi:hypothetical protein